MPLIQWIIEASAIESLITPPGATFLHQKWEEQHLEIRKIAVLGACTREMDPKFHPSLMLKQMVRAKLLGRKTGKDYYDWTKE